MESCSQVTVHQISIVFHGYNTPSFFDLTWFWENFFYSFHPTELKHAGQLDYEVMQQILFQGYSFSNFDKSYSSLKIVQAGFHFKLIPIVFI